MKYSATAYDLFMGPLEALGLRAARRRLMRGLRGRTLEVGTGTGRNLALAPSGAGPSVALDRDLEFLRRARRRSRGAALVCADAHALPFKDGVFDQVVESLMLCSLAEPEKGARELRRVLAPGGELRTLDHVLAPGGVLGRLQQALAPAWLRFTGDCHLDRDAASYLRAAGLAQERRVVWLRGIFEEAVFRRR